MRKAELKKKAQIINEKFVIYKSLQYRWESEETADPQIDDEEYHFTEEEANKAAEEIDLRLGFSAMVEIIKIDYDKINFSIQFREEFDLSDLDDHKKYRSNKEILYQGDENLGKDLHPDSIIVFYMHQTYMNYAYAIMSIEFAKDTILKTESDLVNDSDSISSIYCEHFEGIADLSDSFVGNKCVPFDKLQSGARLTREFLESNL